MTFLFWLNFYFSSLLSDTIWNMICEAWSDGFFSYQISSLKRKFDFGWIALFHSLDLQISYCFNVCFRVKLAEVHDIKKPGFLVPAQASCTTWHVVLETLVENLSWIMNILGTSSFLVALMRDLCMCSRVCICVCVHMCVQMHMDAWG